MTRMNYVVESAVKEKRPANCIAHADVLGASNGFTGLACKLG